MGTGCVGIDAIGVIFANGGTTTNVFVIFCMLPARMLRRKTSGT